MQVRTFSTYYSKINTILKYLELNRHTRTEFNPKDYRDKQLCDFDKFHNFDMPRFFQL